MIFPHGTLSDWRLAVNRRSQHSCGLHILVLNGKTWDRCASAAHPATRDSLGDARPSDPRGSSSRAKRVLRTNDTQIHTCPRCTDTGPSGR